MFLLQINDGYEMLRQAFLKGTIFRETVEWQVQMKGRIRTRAREDFIWSYQRREMHSEDFIIRRCQ